MLLTSVIENMRKTNSVLIELEFGIFNYIVLLVCSLTSQSYEDGSLSNQSAILSAAGIRLAGAGASFPSILYNEWFALYSYNRQKQDVDSTNVQASYTTYDSGLGKLVIFDEEPFYQYGASEVPLNSFEASMKPTLATVPAIAG